jgi:hypothetical protein
VLLFVDVVQTSWDIPEIERCPQNQRRSGSWTVFCGKWSVVCLDLHHRCHNVPIQVPELLLVSLEGRLL